MGQKAHKHLGVQESGLHLPHRGPARTSECRFPAGGAGLSGSTFQRSGVVTLDSELRAAPACGSCRHLAQLRMGATFLPQFQVPRNQQKEPSTPPSVWGGPHPSSCRGGGEHRFSMLCSEFSELPIPPGSELGLSWYRLCVCSAPAFQADCLKPELLTIRGFFFFLINRDIS